MTPEDAQTAVKQGFQGIVVSNYGGRSFPATDSGILALPAIDSRTEILEAQKRKKLFQNFVHGRHLNLS